MNPLRPAVAHTWRRGLHRIQASAAGPGLELTVEVAPPDGVPASKVDETRTALRDLGLSEELVRRMKGDG